MMLRDKSCHVWVCEINQSFYQYGEVHHHLQELRLKDGRFQPYFRLSVTQFENLWLFCISSRGEKKIEIKGPFYCCHHATT